MAVALKHLNGGRELGWHSFIAGCVGGYLVFREDNSVNNQVQAMHSTIAARVDYPVPVLTGGAWPDQDAV